MPTAYLNSGSTTFAAAGWSDATGFATNATLVVSNGGQNITAGLDQSAVATGINYLKIAENFAGNIGTDSDPLKCDVDDVATQWSTSAATSARIEHYGTGVLRYQAAGGSNVCTNYFQSGAGTSTIYGGTLTYATVQAGTFYANASTTLSDVQLLGGTSVVELKTGSLATMVIEGGSHTLRRAASTSIILNGGTLIYDCSSGTTASITINGGTLIHLAGDVTAMIGNGGTYDPSRLQRDSTVAYTYRRFAHQLTNRPNGATLTLTDVRRDPNIKAF